MTVGINFLMVLWGARTRKCGFGFTSAYKLILFAFGISALAQPSPGQWVGDLYLLTTPSSHPSSDPKCFVDKENSICIVIPDVAEVENFPVTLGRYYCSYWYDGALYTMVLVDFGESDDSVARSTHWALAKWHENEWHFLGEYYSPGNIDLLKAIPCANGRFIVISVNTDFKNNNRVDRSPFHLMSIQNDKNELRLVSSIDHGQNELRNYMSNSDCFNLAWRSKVIMTDEYVILINKKTGLYWIFTLEKASLISTGNIFKKLTTEMIVNGGFSQAILCANPERSGTVLIAAQNEEYFMTEIYDAYKEFNEMDKTFFFHSNKEAFEWLNRRIEELAERSPYIVWYRLYPESGKVEKLSVPPEGGAYLRESGKNDVWRPMPDGSVQMGWHEGMLVLQDKPSQKEGSAVETKLESNPD